MESLAQLFVVSMDLLYHFFIISSIFFLQVSELNSKSYLLQGGTAISNGADMNDYSTPGNYYCLYDSYAQSLTNAPFTRAFVLKVEYSNGVSYPRQIFTEYSTGRKAVRYYDGSIWQQYVYFSDDATLFAGTAIQSGDDLNDYTKPGIYYSQDSTIKASLSNMPEFFASGFSLDVKYLGGSSNLIQIITYTSSNGVGSVIYTRRRSNSLWADWYKFSGTIISS